MRLRFGDCELDSESRQLTRCGRPVHVEPKVFELLELLLRRRPAAVSKASIHDRLWPTTSVSESSLTTLVAQARRAVGADARLIRTLRGFGYAIEAESIGLDIRSSPAAVGVVEKHGREAGPCVAWQDRLVWLDQGENVLGRDPEVRVVVDVAGVSRRHARIVVSGLDATIEDLGSKNGTFVGERRIGAPTRLADRDRLRLGRTPIVYRCPRLPASTETEVG